MGCRKLNGGLSIPFIQFADDSLFLLKVDPEVIENLRGMLFILEGVSGLKVNLRKSSLALVGNVQNLGALASLIGYPLFLFQFLTSVYCLG